MIAAGLPLDVAPALDFSVAEIAPARAAAAPTIELALAIDAGERALRGITLGVRVRIHAERRRYEDGEVIRLGELFGPRHAWPRSLGPLLWTQATAHVGPFQGATRVRVVLPCTYDFELAAAKYLMALDGGRVPLELQFEGTIFWSSADRRLQSAPVPWDRDARASMPVEVWREAMAAALGDRGWIVVRREMLGELQAERSRRGLASWEATISALIEDARR